MTGWVVELTEWSQVLSEARRVPACEGDRLPALDACLCGAACSGCLPLWGTKRTTMEIGCSALPTDRSDQNQQAGGWSL